MHRFLVISKVAASIGLRPTLQHHNRHPIQAPTVTSDKVYWRFYKHPLPASVYDVYVKYWAGVSF
jgi:hypothetical protein